MVRAGVHCRMRAMAGAGVWAMCATVLWVGVRRAGVHLGFSTATWGPLIRSSNASARACKG